MALTYEENGLVLVHDSRPTDGDDVDCTRRGRHSQAELNIPSKALRQFGHQFESHDLNKVLQHHWRHHQHLDKGTQLIVSVGRRCDFGVKVLLKDLQVVGIPGKHLRLLLVVGRHLGDFHVQRLHVIGIEKDLILEAVDFEQHHARLNGCDQCEHFFILNEALQLTPHKDTAQKPFQWTHIRAGNILLRMGSWSTQ